MVRSKQADQECQQMAAVLGTVQSPWSIVSVDGDDPRASQWIDMYGINTYPYYITYRGHEALEVANGVMTEQELQEWLGRVQNNGPVPVNSRFAKATAQKSLEAVDREYLQLRLAPGSCGMLGCMAHGGGWVTETVKGPTPKAAGHWEDRVVAGCPSGNCPSGGCPSSSTTQKVWVADPDSTGTVPWNQPSFFGRRR